MRLRLCFFLTSALTFTPSLAFATTITGPYVGVGVGIDVASAQHYRVSSEQRPDNEHPTTEEPHHILPEHRILPEQRPDNEHPTTEEPPEEPPTGEKHSDSSDNGSKDDHSTSDNGSKDDHSTSDNGSKDDHSTSDNGSKDDHSTSDNGSKDDHSTSKTTGDGDPYTDGQKQPGYPYHGKAYHYSESFYKSLQNVRCSVDGAGRSMSGQISASGNMEGQLLIAPGGQPICMIPQEATDYVGQFGYRYALEPYGKIPSSWDFGETWPGLNPFT
ncbi:MAG: hypothetical protein J6P29_06910, partial [Acetobacter sp.]|nr:hypothetical protein [Acetobacter sp.]